MFWGVTLCSLVEVNRHLCLFGSDLDLEDGGNILLRKVGKLLPDFLNNQLKKT
jgi:hypothetical protein